MLDPTVVLCCVLVLAAMFGYALIQQWRGYQKWYDRHFPASRRNFLYWFSGAWAAEDYTDKLKEAAEQEPKDDAP